MAVTVTERYKSRPREKGVDGSRARELIYNCEGSDDDDEIEAALIAEAPLYHAGVPVKSYRIEQEGPELWIGTVRYEEGGTGNAPLPTPGTNTFSFDTTGATTKLTSAPLSAAYGAAAPDFGDFLNCELDGDKLSVHGADITIPSYRWQEKVVMSFENEAAFDTYKAAVKFATGTINDDTFRGYPLGEVLFLGAQGAGTRRNNPDLSFDVEITFFFAQSDNLTNETIAGIAGVDKLGWQYLWIAWRTGLDAYNNLVPQAVGIYIHDAYYTTDFDDLDL